VWRMRSRCWARWWRPRRLCWPYASRLPPRWRRTSIPRPRVSSARRSISPPSRLSRRRPPASPTSARSPRGASDPARRGRRSRQHPKGFHRGQDWHRTLEQRIAAIEFTLAKANLNLGIAVDLHQLRARDLLAVTALQRVDQPLTQRVGTAAELF